MGRVRSAKNKMMRIKKMKAHCPSQLNPILWEEMYVGLTCIKIFHPWPLWQTEISLQSSQPAIVFLDFPSPVKPCQYQNEPIILQLLWSGEKYLEWLSSLATQLLHES